MASYDELAALKNDVAFGKRVEIAVIKFSLYKMDENPATVGHGQAVKWAQNAAAMPTMIAQSVIPAVVLDDAIMAKASVPSTLTDEEIQQSVERAINRVLNS